MDGSRPKRRAAAAAAASIEDGLKKEATALDGGPAGRRAGAGSRSGAANGVARSNKQRAAPWRGRPTKADLSPTASDKRRGKQSSSKSRPRRRKATGGSSDSDSDAEEHASPDLSDSDGDEAAASDGEDSAFEQQLDAAAASDSELSAGKPPAHAAKLAEEEPDAADEGNEDDDEGEDVEEDDGEEGEEEDEEEEEEEYMAKPKRVRKPDRRRGRRRGPRKPPREDDPYAPSESEAVVDDDGGDTGEGVDGPLADGAATGGVPEQRLQQQQQQLAPTELAVSEAVLERAGNYAPTSIPADAFGDAVAAYHVLRAFSWQLRLAPFPLADWCAALAAPQPSPLLDEAHLALVRLLAQDESKGMRAERELDLELLDAVTWPDYVWEWLRYMGDPLAAHQFAPRTSAAGTAAAAAGNASALAAALPPAANGTAAAGAAQLTGPGDAAASGEAYLEQSAPAVDAQTEQRRLRALLRAHFPRHPRRVGMLEYCQLPAAVKAAVAARLTSDVLQVRSVRAEIDRREAAGQFVAGRGGEAGANPMRTPEERAERQKLIASDAEADDGNLDACCLCGLGGNLLCCDGCPAAYHMRCIGEGAKSIPDGEWLCTECSLGGRGEAAGLRVPALGRNTARQPHWAAYNLLFHSALPPFEGRKAHTRELPAQVPMRCAGGGQALVELRGLRRSRRLRAEVPLPSSLPTAEPLPLPEVQAAAGAEGYNNKYRNGWGAAVAAVRAAVEEQRRNKRGTGTPVSQMPAPLPLSRFAWPVSAGRGGGRAALRCGRCQPCLRPTMHKACLQPIAAQPAGGAPGQDSATSWLAPLANYLLKLERDLFGLLDGAWAAPDNTAHRRTWATSVRTAQDARQLAAAAVQLHGALRRTALPMNWERLPGQPAPEPPPLPPGLFNVFAVAMSGAAAQLLPAPSPLPAARTPASASPAVQLPNSSALQQPQPQPQPQPLQHPPQQQRQGQCGKGAPPEAAAEAKQPEMTAGDATLPATAAAAANTEAAADAAPAAEGAGRAAEGTPAPSGSRPPSAAGGSGAATPASSSGGAEARPAARQPLTARQAAAPPPTRSTRASAAKPVNYTEPSAPDSDEDAPPSRRSGVVSRSASFTGGAAAAPGRDAWDDTAVTLDEYTSIPVVARRSAWQRAQGHLRLPRAITRAAARQGGKRRILGLRYAAKDLVVTPAMAWVARAESAATAPQLARCLRALDAAVQWELLRAPGGSGQESQWRGCELHTRRASAHPVGGFEYLVHPKALQSPAVLGGTPTSGPSPMPAWRPAGPALQLPPPRTQPAAALPLPPAEPGADLGKLKGAPGGGLRDLAAASAAGSPLAPGPEASGGSAGAAAAAGGDAAAPLAAATQPPGPGVAGAAPAGEVASAGGFVAAMAAALSEPAAITEAAAAGIPPVAAGSQPAPGAAVTSEDGAQQHQSKAATAAAAATGQPDAAAPVLPAALEAAAAPAMSQQPGGSGGPPVSAGSQGTPQLPAIATDSYTASGVSAGPDEPQPSTPAAAHVVPALEPAGADGKTSAGAAVAAASVQGAPAANGPVSTAGQPRADSPTAGGQPAAADPVAAHASAVPEADAVPAAEAAAVDALADSSAEQQDTAKRGSSAAPAPSPTAVDSAPVVPQPPVKAEAAPAEQAASAPAPQSAAVVSLAAEAAAVQPVQMERRGRSSSPAVPLPQPVKRPPAEAATPEQQPARRSGSPAAARVPAAVGGRRGRTKAPSRLGGLRAPLTSGMPGRSSIGSRHSSPALNGVSGVAPSPAAAAAAAAAARAAAGVGAQPNAANAALAQQLSVQLGLPQHAAPPPPPPLALLTPWPQQRPAGQCGALPFSPAPSTPGQAAPWGHWVHERHLPLWLVRSFEERLRREAAMQVARAAQARAAAQREAQRQKDAADQEAVLQAKQTARQAAKEAAEAAARAAADSCAVCGGEYIGQEEEIRWVACDDCNRWHHGACVGYTEEDEANDNEFVCAACTTRRAEKRRAAMDKARQKRGSGAGGRAAAAVADGGGSRKRRKGKSAKQEWGPELVCICGAEDDDARLTVACDQCGLWCHPECVGEDPGEVSREGVPFSCPTCTRKARRRAALDAERFAAAHEAEAAAAAEKGRRAAEGALREARRADREDAAHADAEARGHGHADWREAAATALQALLAWPASDAFRQPVDPGYAAYHKVIQRPMDLGTIAASLQSGAYAAPQRLLRDVRQVWDNCRAFNYEGDEFWKAGAKCEAKFGKLWAAAGLPTHFTAPAELPVVHGGGAAGLADPVPRIKVKLPGSTPRGGNGGGLKVKLHLGGGDRRGPASDAEARQLGTAVKVLKKFLRRESAAPFAEPVPLDLVPGYAEAIARPADLGTVLATLQRDQYATLAEAAADIQQVWLNCAAFNADGSEMFEAGRAAEAELAAEFVATGLPTPGDVAAKHGHDAGKRKRQRAGDHHTAEDQEAADMLAALGSPRAEQGAEQQQPAGTQRKRRRHSGADADAGAGDGAADVAPPSSKRQRSAEGVTVEGSGSRHSQRRASAGGTAPPPVSTPLPAGPTAASAAEPMSAGQAAAARRCVLAVVASAGGAIFGQPVGPEAPGYRRVVKRPMDLGTVAARLQAGGYGTTGAVWADCELVWANCRAYNGEGSDLDSAAQSARAMLVKSWRKAKLPLPVEGVGSAAGTMANESPPAAGKRGRSQPAAAEPAASPAATQSASPKSARQQGGSKSGASAKTLKDSQKSDNASPQRPAETAAAPAGSRAASRRAAAVPQGERSTPTPDAARAAALGLRVKRQRAAAPSPDTAADAKQPETAVQQEQSTGNVDGSNRRKSGKRRNGGRADIAAAAEDAEPRGTPAVEDAQPRRRSGRR